MTTFPKKPAEQSAPRVIALFFTEFLPGVENDYELLEKASDGPLGLSLPDLQMEALIFGLHCLDRAVFANWGAEYRAVFMDHAVDTAQQLFADVLDDDLREPFLHLFEKQCRARQQDYGATKLLPGDDGALTGVLCWEYTKRICLTAGVDEPLAVKAMLDGATGIFTMMNKIAQAL